jgi:hypothetical protein
VSPKQNLFRPLLLLYDSLSKLDLTKSHSRKPHTDCSSSLDNYLYASPEISERIMKGEHHNKKEHERRISTLILEFEKVFKALS